MNRAIRVVVVFTLLIASLTSCSSENTIQPYETVTMPSPVATTAVPTSLLPTASADFHPSQSPSIFHTLPLQPTASADPITLKEQKRFKFGMSRKDIEKELKKLGIKITDEVSQLDDAPEGFFTIFTDNLTFDLNDQDQLYSIRVDSEVYGQYETVRGLKIGDPVEKIQQLYGKPDECEYVYRCNGYMFSVNTDSNTICGWEVFLNIWNNPDSYRITNAMYSGDDIIQFNENSYSDLFTFGMSIKDVKRKLTELGVRIGGEGHIRAEDGAGAWVWSIDTDHINFGFDKKQRLDILSISGWETAKGLQIGDSIEKLHQLYGKENRKSKDEHVFTYNKKGYKLELYFDDKVTADLGLAAWSIYVQK